MIKNLNIDFLFFAIIVSGIVVTAIAFYQLLKITPTEKPSFEKVAEYENCAIIRWINPSNRYNYFMKCN